MTLWEERKPLSYGCLILLAAATGCGLLAWYQHPGFLAPLAGTGLLCVLVDRRLTAIERKRVQAAFAHAFHGFHGGMPVLTCGAAHGLPVFTLEFRSYEETCAAKAGGHLAAFKASIHQLYHDRGSRENPFDPDKVVSATYPVKEEGHCG